jgi:uncharacterized membrane protein YukC
MCREAITEQIVAFYSKRWKFIEFCGVGQIHHLALVIINLVYSTMMQ